jgi:hypothetical protein
MVVLNHVFVKKNRSTQIKYVEKRIIVENVDE